MSILLLYNINLKNPSFFKKIIKAKKPFDKMPKGFNLKTNPY